MTGSKPGEPLDARALVMRVDLFAELGEAAVDRVAGALARCEVGRGEVLVREGDAGHDLFLVESGDLVVTVLKAGNAVPVGKLGPADFFGETALLRDAPRTATVTAAGDAVVWKLSRESLTELMEAEPAVFERLGAEMRRREVANALRVLQ